MLSEFVYHTIISQVFAGHVVGSRPMKRKEKMNGNDKVFCPSVLKNYLFGHSLLEAQNQYCAEKFT